MRGLDMDNLLKKYIIEMWSRIQLEILILPSWTARLAVEESGEPTPLSAMHSIWESFFTLSILRIDPRGKSMNNVSLL